MSSSMMMDRAGMSMPMGMSGMSQPMGMPAAMPMGPNMMMVPRCTMRFEKVSGGMRIHCMCDDAMACSMMQNLCSMMPGAMCSCVCMMNGMPMCTCMLTMGMWTCENTENGCMMTCTSGDAKCCEMIQACCDCMSAMCMAGCTCCMMMNNMPICCGTCPAPAMKSKR